MDARSCGVVAVGGGGKRVASRVRHEPASIDAVIADLQQVGARTASDQARLQRAINMLAELRADGAHTNPALVLREWLGIDASGRAAAVINARSKALARQIADARGLVLADLPKRHQGGYGDLPQLHLADVRSAQANPALIVFGNGRRRARRPNTKHRAGEIISHNVQAVLYLRDDDQVPYIHGFGDADLDEDALDRGDWNTVIAQLHDETGVEAVLQSNGAILLRGPLT